MCIAGKATHRWHHAGMSPGKNRVPVLGSCTTGRARRRLPAPGLGPVGNELVAGTSVFHSQTGLMGPARRSSHDRLQGTKVLTETSARPAPAASARWLPQLSVTAGRPLQPLRAGCHSSPSRQAGPCRGSALNTRPGRRPRARHALPHCPSSPRTGLGCFHGSMNRRVLRYSSSYRQ